MKRLIATLLLSVLMLAAVSTTVGASAPSGVNEACWGQATAIFAKSGEMGYHASQEETPRMGLHNLAVLLADLGIIEDDSLYSLALFVTADWNLTIDACL